ncbi:hypothetical protein [Thermodesulfovibrio yellowstonii]
MLDRLMHHCYPFFIAEKSYRMKELFEKKKGVKRIKIEVGQFS